MTVLPEILVCYFDGTNKVPNHGHIGINRSRDDGEYRGESQKWGASGAAEPQSHCTNWCRGHLGGRNNPQ